MGLLESLRSGKHKNLFESNNEFAVYSTGFAALDAINAFAVPYNLPDGSIATDIARGVIGGRFITLVGMSGTGKSTLADQIGWNIVKNYKNGLLIHADIEETVLRPRLLEILGVASNSPDNERIIVKKEGVYIEDMLTMIDDICVYKESMKDECMYEEDGKWFGKKKIKIYEPTVVIVDSLPSFTTSSVDTTTVDGQMTTNRDVAMVSQFYTKLLSKINKYNITVIATNHIKPKIVVDIYNPPPSQLMLLSKSETLPRGQAPIFYATNIIRLYAAGKSSIIKKDEYGFDGFEVTAVAAKSKTAFVGASCKLIFREDKGFDEAYTLLATAYDNGIVCGRNPYLYMQGDDTHKFSKSNFGEKYATDPEFRQAIYKAMEPFILSKVYERMNNIAKLNDNKMKVDENGNIVGE